MPVVSYTASKFGVHWGLPLTGSHSLSISWHELVWAAMTIGKPGVAYLLTHGWHSLSDLIVRAHTVYANLRQVPGGLEKSGLYTNLDPTEKGGISYFVGMLAAKVLCARLLDAPWMFHVSMLKVLGGTMVLKGNSQPDLVGRRKNGDWIVAEAKGRTRRYSSTAMTSAKLQTRQLRRVNGAYPALRVGVQAYFAPTLCWALEDPDEYAEDASDIDFNLQAALDMYYAATMDATERGADVRTIAHRQFVTRSISEIGVTVAIEQGIREGLVAHTHKAIDEGNTGEPMFDGEFLVFSDGLAISLDDRWSEQRMQKDPQSRRDDLTA